MSDEKIIVADDHPLFRDGLCRLLGMTLPDADIAEAGSVDEVLGLVETGGAPSLFLLDLLFPGMNPRETLRALRQRCPRSSIIIVSMIEDEATIEKVMDFGADGYIVKSIPGTEMVEAIMAVRGGSYVVARPAIGGGGKALPDMSDIMELTARQREILGLIAAGKSTKQIGRDLDLSPFTVRNHISLLLRAYKVKTRAELARKANSASPP